MKRIDTHSDDQTINAGKEFALRLLPGDIVACYGDLGAGKTRFIKGICESLGVNEHVASPTFIIVNEYHAGGLHICHFDFYRLASLDELREIGFEEYMNGTTICLIEWADKIADALPQKRYDVHIRLGKDMYSRQITIEEIIEIAA